MRTLHKRSLMPAAIGATAIAWIARVLSGRLVADRGDRSDSGDYMRTSLKDVTECASRVILYCQGLHILRDVVTFR